MVERLVRKYVETNDKNAVTMLLGYTDIDVESLTDLLDSDLGVSEKTRLIETPGEYYTWEKWIADLEFGWWER